VLLRLGEARARDFAPLRRALAKLPWAEVLPPGRPLRVDASTTRCRLYHTGALAETVALAIGDATGAPPALAPKATPGEDEELAEPTARVLLRGEDDGFTVSVDASGELLHRRGWRLEAGPAPLRETLAAGMLVLAGWKPGVEPLVDPTCGAGTIVLEAAALARGRAPGAGRAFACEAWPAADADLVRAVRAELTDAPERPSVPIVGLDRDAEVIERARRNAERARLDVRFDVTELASATAPAATGLLIANPPYGRRLPTAGGPGRVAGAIGRALAGPFRGWRAALLVPAARPPHPIARAVGLPVAHTHPLRNGGLRVELLVFEPRRRGATL
jgi:putative N6-adenine-specific DNA methylase